jgi:hypothetical protein
MGLTPWLHAKPAISCGRCSTRLDFGPPPKSDRRHSATIITGTRVVMLSPTNLHLPTHQPGPAHPPAPPRCAQVNLLLPPMSGPKTRRAQRAPRDLARPPWPGPRASRVGRSGPTVGTPHLPEGCSHAASDRPGGAMGHLAPPSEARSATWAAPTVAKFRCGGRSGRRARGRYRPTGPWSSRARPGSLKRGGRRGTAGPAWAWPARAWPGLPHAVQRRCWCT